MLIARRFANALLGVHGMHMALPGGGFTDGAVALIGQGLERALPPPMAEVDPATIAVFISGPTHIPSLVEFQGPGGRRGLQVNSGCWLRQLQPLKTRFGAPIVFGSRFVQTHARIARETGETRVELWSHPRPYRDKLLFVEWLVVAEHGLHERDGDTTPRMGWDATMTPPTFDR